MEKRVYSKPTILRVQLNHEQAVLAICSTATVSTYTGTGIECRPGTTRPCRRVNAPDTQIDSAASS
jgi:hypothetical protein